MTTLELDNETSTLLAEMAKQEHTTLAQLANRLLTECLEDWQDAQTANKAYQRHLDSGEIAHNLDDMVKELGLDS
jgi:thymidine phosphorylase